MNGLLEFEIPSFSKRMSLMEACVADWSMSTEGAVVGVWVDGSSAGLITAIFGVLSSFWSMLMMTSSTSCLTYSHKVYWIRDTFNHFGLRS